MVWRFFSTIIVSFIAVLLYYIPPPFWEVCIWYGRFALENEGMGIGEEKKNFPGAG